jgi:acyl carrier protein
VKGWWWQGCVPAQKVRRNNTGIFFAAPQSQRGRPDGPRGMTQTHEKTPEERLREKLAAFDPDFQQTVINYQKASTPDGLAQIVLGVLAHHAGDTLAEKQAEKGDGVLLIEDLGFDSLALVEISFQAEEFVGIVIQIEDFAGIKTLGDLQGFLRAKAFPAAGAAG